MNRIKIELPQVFSFTTSLPVRITDLNYGGHVGNDRILAFLQEIRMQYFLQWGYTELNLGGTGSIIRDAAIEFKSELFYGDIIEAAVAAGNISKASFDLFYKLEKTTAEKKTVPVVYAKTGIVCYDYTLRRVVAVPQDVRLKLTG